MRRVIPGNLLCLVAGLLLSGCVGSLPVAVTKETAVADAARLQGDIPGALHDPVQIARIAPIPPAALAAAMRAPEVTSGNNALDQVSAVAAFRQGAIQGNPVAQTYLADMYAEGRGVMQDPLVAEFWYRRAALQGYSAAQRRLAPYAATREEDWAWRNLAAAQGNDGVRQEIVWQTPKAGSDQAIAEGCLDTKIWLSRPPVERPAADGWRICIVK